MRNQSFPDLKPWGALSILAVLCGCGKTPVGGLVNSYQYQYRVNGCITPFHSLDSRDDYCNTLADPTKNLDPRTGVVCAERNREADFRINCPGYTWQSQTIGEE